MTILSEIHLLHISIIQSNGEIVKERRGGGKQLKYLQNTIPFFEKVLYNNINMGKCAHVT